MNSNAYGSCWKDLEDFDKDDVMVEVVKETKNGD